MSRHEEWHVTVDGISPVAWFMVCVALDIKPLYIQLSNGRLQLMCAAKHDVSELVSRLEPNIRIVRVKREVSALEPGETALYWECHVKLDGPYEHEYGGSGADPSHGSSRDLFRPERWYVTKRLPHEFDAEQFAGWVGEVLGDYDTHRAGYEYEACLLDTNPDLDQGWL